MKELDENDLSVVGVGSSEVVGARLCNILICVQFSLLRKLQLGPLSWPRALGLGRINPSVLTRQGSGANGYVFSLYRGHTA